MSPELRENSENCPPNSGPQNGPTGDSTGRLDVLRIIDANANRAAEGLRVVEDFARFVLDDAHLSRLAKQIRHDLTATLADVDSDRRLAARETRSDVGTAISTGREYRRIGPRDVAAAGFKRLQQALRALEEYGKLLDGELSPNIESLRYRVYSLERAVALTDRSRHCLDDARLHVLVDGGRSLDELADYAARLIAAGVDVVQLRDKRLDDRSLLDRARRLKQLTAEVPTLFIMNDRPDLARLARADGVHVGQEDLSVREVRRIVGPDTLVGVSTHNIAQARQAVLDGANYIGVGPTFPTQTKTFDHFPGLEFLREVASQISLPTYAIGGITIENLPDVLETGTTRVAVSGGIHRVDDPIGAVREMRAMLNE